MWLHCIQKGNSSNIHNVIKYLTIRLSDDNTTTHVCTICTFVLKNIQNFVDLDACKQLFVLNSYKSEVKKIVIDEKLFQLLTTGGNLGYISDVAFSVESMTGDATSRFKPRQPTMRYTEPLVRRKHNVSNSRLADFYVQRFLRPGLYGRIFQLLVVPLKLTYLAFMSSIDFTTMAFH